jgi:hypothetical protein
MKSLFLVPLICLMIAGPAMSQTKRTKKSPQNNSKKVRKVKRNTKRVGKTKKTVMPIAETKVEDKSHFDKFNDRLRVIYFSIYSTSPLTQWNSDFAPWKTFSDSPKTGCGYNCDDSTPSNLFNLLILVYNYSPSSSFVIQPRWSVNFGQNSKDQGLLQLEDWVVAWGHRIKFSDTFNIDFRPGFRIPTSRASRNGDKAGLGDLTGQPDIQVLVNWVPAKDWSFQWVFQNRFWVYEDRFNETRHRIAQTYNLNYQYTDKLSLQGYVDYWLQNSDRRLSLNGKSTSYKQAYFNVYGGPSYMFTPKFGVTPLLGVYADDPNLSWHSLNGQVWFLYLF